LAQHNNYNGNVRIVSDPRIDKLAEEYPEIAGQIHSMEGFRIQIFFDSGNFSQNLTLHRHASGLSGNIPMWKHTLLFVNHITG
jgi:hypothetical protein